MRGWRRPRALRRHLLRRGRTRDRDDVRDANGTATRARSHRRPARRWSRSLASFPAAPMAARERPRPWTGVASVIGARGRLRGRRRSPTAGTAPRATGTAVLERREVAPLAGGQEAADREPQAGQERDVEPELDVVVVVDPLDEEEQEG